MKYTLQHATAKTAKFSKAFILLFISLILSVPLMSQNLLEFLPLIPKPQSSIIGKGSFNISNETLIYISGDGSKNDADIFNEYLQQYYGFRLKIMSSKQSKEGAINLRKEEKNPELKPDAYALKISPEKIEILGGAGAGAFYGLQSLIQLLPPAKVTVLSIPAIEIKDEPRFAWRGMHLDVSRHFFSVEFIKKYIDYLASYKLNTFHWHLTDDQGWRVEIKKYPKLQEISAFRNGTLIGHLGSVPERYDSIRYGAYYTQEQISDIVDYATNRHIQIVPEIEMPGHAMAALAAYPELACTDGPFETAKKWGVFKDVFCPTEQTFEFFENVLKEVARMFPGKYIHVGGDECPKDRWKESEFCQSLMKEKGLKDEHELQSYFMGRIEKILASLNKKMIGWDEILDGGLASSATVMSWRGYKGGIVAAGAGHDVVMTPTSFCYFDFYQSKYPGEPLAIGGYLPLDRVYQFEPIPDVLNAEQSKHILGAQANLWTEYISTPDQVEYMAMPRMAALAEVLWSSPENINYDAFTKRLVSHFKLLDFKKVNYSKAIFDIQESVYPHSNNGALAIELSTSYKPGVIRYTLSGDEPGVASPQYKDKIVVDQSIGIRAKVFDGSISKGTEYSRIFKVNLATGKEIILAHPPHEEYSRGGGFTLVNGITGNLPWMGSDWLGFLGENFEATIDLGKEMTISKVGIDVLRDENSWIYFPKGAEVFISTDGENFTSLKKLEAADLNPDQRLIQISFERTKARWVKVMALNYGIIPADRPGEGRPAWLLVDEISIN